MKISLANFRAVRNATIYVQKKDASIGGTVMPVRVTFVAGHNYAGKTSIAQAIAAALTGEPKIYPDIIKKNIAMLVRQGEKQAMVRITDDLEQEFRMTVTWPECAIESKGTPISASRIAVGLESLALMSPKERMSYFSDKLNATPTQDELRECLTEVKLPDAAFNEMWETITTYGWDAAYDNRVEAGRQLKRQWQNITGENYGTKKGDSWLPDAWEPELMNAKEDDLKSAVDDAKEWYDAALRGVALSESEYTELKSLAENIDQQKKIVEDERERKVKAQDKLEILRNKRSALDVKTGIFQCPSCESYLVYDGGDTATLIDPNEKQKNDDSAKKKKALAKDIEAAQAEYDEAVRSVQNNERLARDCEKAQATIASYNEGKKKDHANLDDAKTKLEKAESRLLSYLNKREADSLHERIIQEAAVVNTLAPTGLRHDKLSKAVVKVNATLAKICEKAGWGNVMFDPDMNLYYKNDYGFDAPYFLCSESEQYRIRATLQIYIAAKEKAPIVLFDRFDILDSKGRNGLMGYAIKSGMPTVFFVTTNDMDGTNNLQKFGASVYWLTDGMTKEA